MKLRWETYEDCEYPKIHVETGENTQLRNMALGGVLETLAEKVRYYCNQKLRRNYGFVFGLGNLTFDRVDDVIQYIHENVRRLVDNRF